MTHDEIDSFGKHILCIDDSTSQLVLYKSQLEGMFRVTCAATYEDSVACLSATHPDLIILDMTMPHVSGLEFLDILRLTPHCTHIPVIIVSSDENPQDIKAAFRKGAADYVRKPYDEEELVLRISRIFQLLHRSENRESVPEARGIFSPAQVHIIESLSELASARDNEKSRHMTRIGLYCEELAKTASKAPRFRDEIQGDFVELIGSLARLHDIGKVGIPEYILKKDGPLTDREFELVRRHTLDGAATMARIQESFPDYAFLDFARNIILFHHEHWDGSGYPQGISGKDIPLQARITAIADTFDIQTTRRPYAAPAGYEEAFRYIIEESGTRFDPDLVDVLRICSSRFIEIRSGNEDSP